MGFTEKQGAMVKESWKVLKEDIPHNSFRFFSLILEIAPAAKGMFSFLKDSDEIPENNTKLKAHAVIVFKLTCESAVQLGDTGKVEIQDSLLKWLGTVHLEKGVVDPHFEVVKKALLGTIKEGLGDVWNEEVNDAWSEAYDQLALVIKNAMKEKDEQQTT